MGLFDKKECSICGAKIGLLGNKKLSDGNMCKDCEKKLSVWFKNRKEAKKALEEKARIEKLKAQKALELAEKKKMEALNKAEPAKEAI